MAAALADGLRPRLADNAVALAAIPSERRGDEREREEDDPLEYELHEAPCGGEPPADC